MRNSVVARQDMHPSTIANSLLCMIAVALFTACGHGGMDTRDEFQRSVDKFSEFRDIEALVDSLAEPLIGGGI